MFDYKAGDHVVYVGHYGMRRNNDFFPPVGSVGIVIRKSGCDEVFVQWPTGSTSSDDRWYCMFSDIKPCDFSEYDDKVVHHKDDVRELNAFFDEMMEIGK